MTLDGLVNPARYGEWTRHAGSPYKYFTPALRQFFYSRSRVMEGVPYDRDGRTDFGVAGHLVGDWFHSSLPVDPSSAGSPGGWTKSIAFARDWYDGRPRVSIGGTIAAPFVAAIGPTDPDPATVTPTTGLLAYQVTVPGGVRPHGWLLLQLTASDRLEIEFFDSTRARPTAFTGAAQEYRR